MQNDHERRFPSCSSCSSCLAFPSPVCGVHTDPRRSKLSSPEFSRVATFPKFLRPGLTAPVTECRGYGLHARILANPATGPDSGESAGYGDAESHGTRRVPATVRPEFLRIRLEDRILANPPATATRRATAHGVCLLLPARILANPATATRRATAHGVCLLLYGPNSCEFGYGPGIAKRRAPCQY